MTRPTCRFHPDGCPNRCFCGGWLTPLRGHHIVVSDGVISEVYRRGVCDACGNISKIPVRSRMP